VGRKVRASFTLSDRTYGARRVWHDVLADGVDCGLHRIERLMRQQGLRARPHRRGLPRDHGEKSVVAANVLDRRFVADAPNQNGWQTSRIARLERICLECREERRIELLPCPLL
jgi:putative transposase